MSAADTDAVLLSPEGKIGVGIVFGPDVYSEGSRYHPHVSLQQSAQHSRSASRSVQDDLWLPLSIMSTRMIS